MRKKNKSGMELSINFLVGLVLALGMFIMGLKFLAGFFTKAESLRESLNDQTKAEIEKLLSSGKKVAIPVHRATIPQGEHYVFGMGVYNNNPQKQLFWINARVKKFIPKDPNMANKCEPFDTTQPPANNNKQYCPEIQVRNDYTIKNNQKQTLPVVVITKDNTAIGDYIIDVNVCSGPYFVDNYCKEDTGDGSTCVTSCPGTASSNAKDCDITPNPDPFGTVTQYDETSGDTLNKGTDLSLSNLEDFTHSNIFGGTIDPTVKKNSNDNYNVPECYSRDEILSQTTISADSVILLPGMPQAKFFDASYSAVQKIYVEVI